MPSTRRHFLRISALTTLGLGLAAKPLRAQWYFSSQRGLDGKHGMTFEVTGPFRLGRS